MSSVGVVALAAATIFADFRAAFLPRAAFGRAADLGRGAASLAERGFLTAPRFRAAALRTFASPEATVRLSGRLLMIPQAVSRGFSCTAAGSRHPCDAPLRAFHLLPRASRAPRDW